MNKESINKIVAEYSGKESKKMINRTYQVKGLSLAAISEFLMVHGHVCEEDLDKRLYVAKIKGGFKYRNTATMGICLDADQVLVAICAKEGLIKQHTCEGILNEFEKRFDDFIQ